MYSYNLAHYVSLCLCLYLSLSLCILHPFLSFTLTFGLASSVFLPQTVLDVELRSSRVSLSWRWRNSGMSAASDVGPATWSLPENTSASECMKENIVEKNTTCQRMSRSAKESVLFSYGVFRFKGYTVHLTHYITFFRISYVAGMECHTVRQITTPSTG